MKAFKMTEDLKKYFTLFVALDEPELNIARLSFDELAQQMLKIRNRINNKKEKNEEKHSNALFETARWLEVYASLGSATKGASVFEISRRSKLPQQDIEKILKK